MPIRTAPIVLRGTENSSALVSRAFAVDGEKQFVVRGPISTMFAVEEVVIELVGPFVRQFKFSLVVDYGPSDDVCIGIV